MQLTNFWICTLVAGASMNLNQHSEAVNRSSALNSLAEWIITKPMVHRLKERCYIKLANTTTIKTKLKWAYSFEYNCEMKQRSRNVCSDDNASQFNELLKKLNGPRISKPFWLSYSGLCELQLEKILFCDLATFVFYSPKLRLIIYTSIRKNL